MAADDGLGTPAAVGVRGPLELLASEGVEGELLHRVDSPPAAQYVANVRASTAETVASSRIRPLGYRTSRIRRCPLYGSRRSPDREGPAGTTVPGVGPQGDGRACPIVRRAGR